MKNLLSTLLAICAAVSVGRATEPSVNPVLAPHTNDLVVLKGEQLVPYDAEQFVKAPLTVLYFGAGWCPDCRKFSPALVSAYDGQPRDARQFEVLLISRDKDAEGLLKFMKVEKMRWPALAFDKVASASDLQRFYSGHGIPCVTVIDSKGKILLQSKSDQDGQQILGEFEELLHEKKPHN
jgi:nucleoredoxin